MARPSSQHPSYRAPCAAQGPKLQEPEAPTVTRTTGCSLHSFIFAAASLQTSPCDSTTSCAHRPQQRTGVTGPPDLHALPSRIRQCSGKCRRSPSHPGYHTTMCSTEHHQHWAGPSPALPTSSHSVCTAVLPAQGSYFPFTWHRNHGGAVSRLAGPLCVALGRIQHEGAQCPTSTWSTGMLTVAPGSCSPCTTPRLCVPAAVWRLSRRAALCQSHFPRTLLQIAPAEEQKPQ